MIAPSRGMATIIALVCNPENRGGCWRSDRHLETHASAEGDPFAGLDLDCLTGRRIAAYAGSTIPHLQNSKTSDLHPFAPCRVESAGPQQ